LLSLWTRFPCSNFTHYLHGAGPHEDSRLKVDRRIVLWRSALFLLLRLLRALSYGKRSERFGYGSVDGERMNLEFLNQGLKEMLETVCDYQLRI